MLKWRLLRLINWFNLAALSHEAWSQRKKMIPGVQNFQKKLISVGDWPLVSLLMGARKIENPERWRLDLEYLSNWARLVPGIIVYAADASCWLLMNHSKNEYNDDAMTQHILLLTYYQWEILRDYKRLSCAANRRRAQTLSIIGWQRRLWRRRASGGASQAVLPADVPRLEAWLGLISVTAVACSALFTFLLHTKYSNNRTTVNTTRVRTVRQSLIGCDSIVPPCTLTLPQ